MRVIAGTAKGHPLKAPKGRGTRPTADRVRESVFNVLAPYTPDARVLDGFAGTGALGIEALSRGAGVAVFVEHDPDVAAIIRDNLDRTGLTSRARVLVQDVSRVAGYASLGPYDLIFLDPPYDRGWVVRVLDLFGDGTLLTTEGLLVLEHSRREAAPEEAGRLRRVRQLTYGDTQISLFRGRHGE